MASKYGPTGVGEGIRNLEAAAHAGKVSATPAINQLAVAIYRSLGTATAIKALPSKISPFDNTVINLPSCTT